MNVKASYTEAPPTPDPLHDQGSRLGWWRIAVLAGLIVAAMVVAKVCGLFDKLDVIRLQVESLGVWGKILFALAYIALSTFGFPFSWLNIAAGVFFDFPTALILCVFGYSTGFAFGFLFARKLARRQVAAWVARHPRLSRIDEQIARHGGAVVAFARLAFLPNNVLNYTFGVSRVGFATYCFWTCLTLIPHAVINICLGGAVYSVSAIGRVPWKLVSLGGAFLALLAIVIPLAWRRMKGG